MNSGQNCIIFPIITPSQFRDDKPLTIQQALIKVLREKVDDLTLEDLQSVLECRQILFQIQKDTGQD